MRKAPRLVIYLVALTFALALLVPPLSAPRRAAAAPAANSPTVLTFPETGHAVRTGAFVSYFQTYGGVQTFGYPLADEAWEDGRLVQYFERQRFEYHPENAGTSYEVLLGRLGNEAAQGRAPFPTVAPFAGTTTRTYVAATQHSLAEPFLSYWQSHGGVRILGYPISEVVNENGLQVQYFERARFERHPENAGSTYEVLLSLLGRAAYEQHLAPVAPAAPSAPAPPAVNGMEAQLLSQINTARGAAGLHPVALDAQLVALARDRSADMANRGYFDHRTPDGKNFLDMMRARSIPFVMAGEIIAENNYPTNQTVGQAYQGYMASPEHHQIIMMGNWTAAGVGEAVDGKGMYYYTVLFSQPSK